MEQSVCKNNKKPSTSVNDKEVMMCKCHQCKAYFPDTDIKRKDYREVCPVCESSEWCYERGTNLLELSFKLDVACYAEQAPSELRNIILGKIAETLQSYHVNKVEDTTDNYNYINQIPF